MPKYHWLGVVPLRDLVPLFEIVRNLRSLWAAQVHEEVVCAVYSLDHEQLHLRIANLAEGVHVFQFLGVAETVVRHLFGQPLSEGCIVLQFGELIGGHKSVHQGRFILDRVSSIDLLTALPSKMTQVAMPITPGI